MKADMKKVEEKLTEVVDELYAKLQTGELENIDELYKYSTILANFKAMKQMDVTFNVSKDLGEAVKNFDASKLDLSSIMDMLRKV